MRPSQVLSRSAAVLLLSSVLACVGAMPPPPELEVTSPERGLIQGGGQVVVTGTARPGPDGAAVTRVRVNDVTARLDADGSFTATIEVPPGAMLLETTASSEAGGSATDARAVQVGELRPVGAPTEQAVVAALSAEAFARLSAAAGPLLMRTDFEALLAPLQPMAGLGDSFANLELSITRFALGGATITLTPTDGGLAFSAQLTGLTVAADADYGGSLVIDGSTSIGVTAEQITIAGTLAVTPTGTFGFTTRITAPSVRTTALRLDASGLTGQVLRLMNDSLGSTVQDLVTSTAERALEPLLNDALGALAGPRQIAVLDQRLALQAAPSAVTFSSAGALVAMDVQAALAGGEASDGYVFTPNGTPRLDVSRGVQLALSDDLMNDLLAQVHALDLLHVRIEEDFGLFDTIDIRPMMPPMINASGDDGAMRLVLGDMIATVSKGGDTVISAAINARIDLEVEPGTRTDQIGLKFGAVHLVVNIDDATDETGGIDLTGAARAGIRLQLESLAPVLITVPVPAVAGVSLGSLSLRADSGYVVVGGEVR